MKNLSGLSKSPISMGIFHPQNWLMQGTSHPLALSSQTQIHQMIKNIILMDDTYILETLLVL